MNLAQTLIRLAELTRRYASFFWYPNKRVAEVGVVRTFLEATGSSEAHDIRSAPEDPPDVIAVDSAGVRTGFEVTELVDREAVARMARGEFAVAFWTEDRLLQEVERAISVKDRKGFRGGPYGKRVLIIHTDEFGLAPHIFLSILQNSVFPRPRNLDEVYFLFSFDALTESYPVAQVRFEHSQ